MKKCFIYLYLLLQSLFLSVMGYTNYPVNQIITNFLNGYLDLAKSQIINDKSTFLDTININSDTAEFNTMVGEIIGKTVLNQSILYKSSILRFYKNEIQKNPFTNKNDTIKCGLYGFEIGFKNSTELNNAFNILKH